MVRTVHHNASFGFLADAKAGINRGKIVAMRTRHVTRTDFQAVLAGVQRGIAESKKTLAVVDLDHVHEADTWLASATFPARDLGFGPQANYYGLYFPLLEHKTQNTPEIKDRLHVLVIDQDLFGNESDPEDWYYGGQTFPGFLISTARFRSLDSTPERKALILSQLAMHEFGHALGLTNRNFNADEGLSDTPEGDRRYYQFHCAGVLGPCLMQQIDMPGRRTMLEQAELLKDLREAFCRDCRSEIEEHRRVVEAAGGRW